MTDQVSLESDDLTALPDSARRVALLLRERGHSGRVVMLPETGKTSAEAAAGLGCSVAQIAKSILFRRRDDDAPVLVVASGVSARSATPPSRSR
jgi:prolyl-tRNA editing enzyme YbaK/EbsC (Cys-tRNA(Pro) deacylase)